MNEIMNIRGVDCYEEKGTVYLNLEAVAKGLGFTTTQMVKGTEYTNIRWNRVDEYLNEFGFATCGKRPEFIPENIFYRLAMKAKNETAEKFQAKVADEIIPSIRKTGSYGGYTPKLDEIHLKAMELIAECSPDKLPYMAMILQDMGIHFTINMGTYSSSPNTSDVDKEHDTGKKPPVYNNTDNHVNDFLQGVNAIDRPTNEVYRKYVEYCSNHGIDPVSNIAFSKMVNKILGSRVIQKKINGVNRKIFTR